MRDHGRTPAERPDRREEELTRDGPIVDGSRIGQEKGGPEHLRPPDEIEVVPQLRKA
jgi:hypothetical protein